MALTSQNLRAADGLDQLVSVADWVRWGAARFERAGLVSAHGYTEAWDEAAALTWHVLGLPLDEHRVDWRMPLSHAQRQRLDALFQRRIRERRPAAYLIGETLFAGLRFFTDERALVPRSPIAELIVNGYRPWARPGQIRTVLDMCTGGGCIAVASAVHLRGTRVDAVDISPDALALARENVALHNVEAQVGLIRSDLFRALGGRRYDLIVSNPPYVSADAYHALPREFGYEPPVGLRAGEDGLAIVNRLLAEAADFLRPGGILIAEVGCSRAALEKALPRVPFCWLDFERGGEGVLLLEGDGLKQAQAAARHRPPGRGRRHGR